MLSFAAGEASAVVHSNFTDFVNPAGPSLAWVCVNVPMLFGPILKRSTVWYAMLVFVAALVPRCATCIAPLIIRFLFDKEEPEVPPISAASSAALLMLGLR